MFKHIVLWQLKETANGRSQSENAHALKEKFEALMGVVPGLRHIEVGLDIMGGEDSADLSLYTEFDSRAAFEAYYVHPSHKALLPFLREARAERRVIDYEI